MLALALFHPPAWADETTNTDNAARTCQQSDSGVANFTAMFTCGTVHGTFRTLYYSTHNAYFVKNNNQDTASYGGSIKYLTAPYLGLSFGVSGILQRGLWHGDDSRMVSELRDNQDNIGEAYVNWQYRQLRITAGNQRLNIPFISDYDWRITPILFRAVDARYGDKENFVHATKAYRYKPWGSDQFLSTTAYTSVQTKTNGVWAVGGGQAVQLGAQKLKGELWYDEYDDYVRLFFTEAHLIDTDSAWTPDLGLQFMRGTSEGKALAGEVDNVSYGAQFSFTPTRDIKWSFNYNHIAASHDAYGNGALVTPYSRQTSSGRYFAQPFFTSTQDLGSGNAYSTRLSYQATPALTVGAYYSFMDLRESVNLPSRNQSEYLVFASYQFSGALKGLSLSDFVGVQTSPRYDQDFWQNRLSLQYTF
ncbi:OprD family outer membrane porin [Brenneria salicis]|nr:outer membrane receptor protein [Brenneria salicis ATCC 15712 = DSM 30166]